MECNGIRNKRKVVIRGFPHSLSDSSNKCSSGEKSSGLNGLLVLPVIMHCGDSGHESKITMNVCDGGWSKWQLRASLGLLQGKRDPDESAGTPRNGKQTYLECFTHVLYHLLAETVRL